MRKAAMPAPTAMAKDAITLSVNQRNVCVARGSSVAAAVAIAGELVTRLSVSGQPRAPFCGMGVCQECRVTIDGCAHQLACQTLCTPGMRVSTGANAIIDMAPAASLTPAPPTSAASLTPAPSHSTLAPASPPFEGARP